MKYEAILFDFDGVIIDSMAGIINGLKLAFGHFNMKVSESDLKKCVGPPLKNSFIKYGSFTNDEDTEEAIEIFRTYYSETGSFESQLFPEIKEVLEHLKEKGYKLAIASAKYEKALLDIAKHYGLTDYFEAISGSGADETSSGKTIILERTLEKLNVDKSKTLFIGDTKYDATAAKEVGVDFIGALYGYGEKEDFIANGNPIYFANTTKDIEDFVNRV